MQKDLVLRSKMEQPTVAEHLNRLEKLGFITRRRDETDGRVARIFLTPKAKEMSGRLIDEVDRGSLIFTEGIPPEDLEVFDRVICQIMQRLEDFMQSSDVKPSRKRAS